MRGQKLGSRSYELIKHLPGLTGLRRLDLGPNDLDAGMIRALMKAVQQLPNLESLDLSENDMGDD